MRKQFFIYCALPLLLQGCGFKLANSNSPISVCLVGKQANEIKNQLHNAIHCSKQSTKIKINAISLNQQEVSNNTNSSLQQFQINHFINFDVLSANQKSKQKNITLSVSKPFIYNANGILSSSSEQALLNNEAKQELIEKFEAYLRQYRHLERRREIPLLSVETNFNRDVL